MTTTDLPTETKGAGQYANVNGINLYYEIHGSGRPLVLTDQLGKMDALVASWLPGSQGEGVADVLFGERPFTGRLSMTWPRSLEQEPINVGDRDYHPLFPYGFGLRTSVR